MKVWREGRLEEASTSMVVDVEEGSSGTPDVLILVGVVGGERREVDGLSTTMTEVALAARVPARKAKKKKEEGGKVEGQLDVSFLRPSLKTRFL